MKGDENVIGVSEYEDGYSIVFVTRGMPFTNWSAHQVDIWGKQFPTVEHAFHYKKFAETDPDWAEKIRNAKSPWEAWRLGWKRPIDTEWWDARREEVIYELIKAKVAQHADVREALVKSNGRMIMESGDDTDAFWGVGFDYGGQNKLGEIWVRVRDELL